MARTAKATSSTQPPASKRPSTGTPTPARKAQAAKATAAKTPPAKAAKRPADAGRSIASDRAGPAARIEELRARIEKLEQETTRLRTRERAASRDAKQSAVRMAGLEDRLEELDRKIAATAKPAKRAARRPRDIDPGDSVPEGVAVLEPEPMDQEAENAFENLEEHLRPR
jgi:ABC-type transporter Mla subunit MlaD